MFFCRVSIDGNYKRLADAPAEPSGSATFTLPYKFISGHPGETHEWPLDIRHGAMRRTITARVSGSGSTPPPSDTKTIEAAKS